MASADKKYPDSHINLLIGTPAYGCMVHMDYFNSVMSYINNPNIQITTVMIGNESLITRARNKIFSYFVNSNNFDYLLFLDADITFTFNELYKLLSSGKDLIGAPVRLKDSSRNILNTGIFLEDDEYPIVKTDRIGTAVMLISKEVAIKVAEWAKNENHVYNDIPFYVRKDGNNLDIPKTFDVFQVKTHNGEYLSEDYWFCKLVRNLGYNVYVHLEAYSAHSGNVKMIYGPDNNPLSYKNNNNRNNHTNVKFSPLKGFPVNKKTIN